MLQAMKIGILFFLLAFVSLAQATPSTLLMSGSSASAAEVNQMSPMPTPAFFREKARQYLSVRPTPAPKPGPTPSPTPDPGP
jgi:hypothetical protein